MCMNWYNKIGLIPALLLKCHGYTQIKRFEKK